jgi:HK97 family phage portal protein
VASLWDRLLNRTPPAPVEDAKAATGPGVFALTNYPSVSSLARHPAKLMSEAQALYHTQAWVNAAERAIVGRYVAAAWHLEQADGDTVDRDASPAEQAVVNFIEQPNPKRSRRQLWSLTLRHMGLCGNAFWYLDQRAALGGAPLQVLYINPVRMTPVENEAKELLGWLMDASDNPLTPAGAKAVPFTLEEVIHFILDEPDSGHWGIGIAEAAYNKILLDSLGDSYLQQVLASGGRIAGLLSPKSGEKTMNDDQWQATVRDYRNIVGDPDAAKRLHIVRGPVDFTETASKPSELQYVELSSASRENILAAWGVPLSQIGVMQSSGLNSGEHVKYEEAALWQGAIEYRGSAFEEKVQRELVDLFDLGLTLVVDTPAFDDQQPLYVNAEKAKVVPLTVDERRALVGLDPLEDAEVGAAIFLDQSMVQINTTGPAEQEAPPPVDASLGKAALPDDLARLRRRVEREFTPQLRQSLETVFRAMSKDIRRKVVRRADHISAQPADESVWWDEERWTRQFSETLQPALAALVRTTGRNASRRLAAPAKADDEFIGRVLEYVRVKGGDRIRSMLRTTRDAVAKVIADGVRQGMSPAELGDAIEAAAGLDEYRAELISRTETMYAYNDAAIGTYREFGVAEVQAIDGDMDEECAARNGNVYSLDEASGITDHPNGTLDWVPLEVAPAKAAPRDVSMGVPSITIPMTVNMPEQPAPIVNVAQPDISVPFSPVVHVAPAEITIPAPVVNVEPALVTVEAAKASGPTEVIVTSLPDRVHKLARNKKGEATGSVETDA